VDDEEENDYVDIKYKGRRGCRKMILEISKAVLHGSLV